MEKDYPPSYNASENQQGWNVPPATAPPPQYSQRPPIGQPQVTRAVMVGRSPISVTCPNCGSQITTRVEAESSPIAWISAGVMCLMGLWCGCCCIPLCMDTFKDYIHTCPNCNAVIGRQKALT
eukprot:TRINITY_DN2679_c0_g1_i1.p1 TRINITY_DN2679_c0_g1~~TRINITY_DN2679_c0_g1_i1.p1  ORF type:complete len:136 (-),score=7.75 TRINITY_DN2679_c0_g1_i1:139-507(-)